MKRPVLHIVDYNLHPVCVLLSTLLLNRANTYYAQFCVLTKLVHRPSTFCGPKAEGHGTRFWFPWQPRPRDSQHTHQVEPSWDRIAYEKAQMFNGSFQCKVVFLCCRQIVFLNLSWWATTTRFSLEKSNGINNCKHEHKLFFETLCCFEMGKDTKPKGRPNEL